MVRIATAQFPVSANIARNRDYMLRCMQQASEAQATLIHFGECALSGYCGPDFESWSAYDWMLLKESTLEISSTAREMQMWVVFGSSHQLSHEHLPHNCVYVIDADGKICTRYDKRRCSVRDLNNYTPGENPITFAVEGVRFGVLICLDYRFPELYAEYLELKVDCVLHSFHDARKKGKALSTMIAPPTLQGHAGNYVMWLSVANNSASYQSFPSMMIDPMGIIKSKAQRHVTDVIVNDIDLSEYDAYMNMVRSFRSQARTGEVYQLNYVDDARSSDRKTL